MTTLTHEQLDALRALAAAATQGEWSRSRTFGQLNIQNERYMLGDDDATYIAALQPATLLEIIRLSHVGLFVLAYADYADERAGYEAWSRKNLPQFFGLRAPTWEMVESNVLRETWNAWIARALLSPNTDYYVKWRGPLTEMARRLAIPSPDSTAPTSIQSPAPFGPTGATKWFDAASFPPDHRQVLAEIEPQAADDPPQFVVARYFRTQKGVHEGEPAWVEPSTNAPLKVLRWQFIDVGAPAKGGRHA